MPVQKKKEKKEIVKSRMNSDHRVSPKKSKKRQDDF